MSVIRTYYRFIIAIFVIYIFSIPTSIFGQSSPLVESCGDGIREAECTLCHLVQIFNNVYIFSFGIISSILILIIIYVGFTFIIAQDNVQKRIEVIRSVKYLLLGIIIIFASFPIVNTVLVSFGYKDTIFQPFKSCLSVELATAPPIRPPAEEEKEEPSNTKSNYCTDTTDIKIPFSTGASGVCKGNCIQKEFVLELNIINNEFSKQSQGVTNSLVCDVYSHIQTEVYNSRIRVGGMDVEFTPEEKAKLQFIREELEHLQSACTEDDDFVGITPKLVITEINVYDEHASSCHKEGWCVDVVIDRPSRLFDKIDFEDKELEKIYNENMCQIASENNERIDYARFKCDGTNVGLELSIVDRYITALGESVYSSTGGECYIEYEDKAAENARRAINVLSGKGKNTGKHVSRITASHFSLYCPQYQQEDEKNRCNY